MIDFEIYYSNFLKKFSSKNDFYIHSLKEKKDLCSNIAIKSANNIKEIPFTAEKIAKILQNSQDFEEVSINNHGIIFWNIPTKFWLLKFQETLESLTSVKASFTNKTYNIFPPLYMYTRIISVQQYFKKKFSNEKILSISELKPEIITRHEMINLIKVSTNWLEYQAGMNDRQVLEFLYKLATEFNRLWNNPNNETEMCFIIKEDLNSTKMLICCLNVFQRILESAFSAIGIVPMKELK